MEKRVSTYGKIIPAWHSDQDQEMPLGSAMIRMGFTKDGQLRPELLEARDKRLKVSSAEKKKQREVIPMPKVDPGANAWEKGEARQFVISNKADSAHHKHEGPPQRK